MQERRKMCCVSIYTLTHISVHWPPRHCKSTRASQGSFMSSSHGNKISTTTTIPAKFSLVGLWGTQLSTWSQMDCWHQIALLSRTLSPLGCVLWAGRAAFPVGRISGAFKGRAAHNVGPGLEPSVWASTAFTNKPQHGCSMPESATSPQKLLSTKDTLTQ